MARGGGAPEELAAFNDERVARAVFASRVPVVTGVGHETDTTIVDYVADLRAPTPSAAAELIAPDVSDLAQTVEGLAPPAVGRDEYPVGRPGRRPGRAARDRLSRYSPQAQVAQWRQRVDSLAETGRLHLGHTLSA